MLRKLNVYSLYSQAVQKHHSTLYIFLFFIFEYFVDDYEMAQLSQTYILFIISY